MYEAHRNQQMDLGIGAGRMRRRDYLPAVDPDFGRGAVGLGRAGRLPVKRLPGQILFEELCASTECFLFEVFNRCESVSHQFLGRERP